MDTVKSRLSFCTVCKDDLELLKQTMPENIMHNEAYENLEFIILDCSQTDQLNIWLNKSFARQIDTGRVIYHSVDNPEQCTHATAKNIVASLASGDIICFIHPGHYTGPGFAAYVNEAFALHADILLSTPPVEFHETTRDHPPGSLIGKLCVTKKDFVAVKGFDEKMIKFSNNDIDLVYRLKMHGLERKLVTGANFGEFIDRKAGQGFSLFKGSSQVASIYVSHISPSASEILFLYMDNHFEKGILTDQSTMLSDDCESSFKQSAFTCRYSFRELENGGSWTEYINEGIIRFRYRGIDSFDLRLRYRCRYDELIHTQTERAFYMVTDQAMIEKLLIMNNVFYNNTVMEKNASKKGFVEKIDTNSL